MSINPNSPGTNTYLKGSQTLASLPLQNISENPKDYAQTEALRVYFAHSPGTNLSPSRLPKARQICAVFS